MAKTNKKETDVKVGKKAPAKSVEAETSTTDKKSGKTANKTLKVSGNGTNKSEETAATKKVKSASASTASKKATESKLKASKSTTKANKEDSIAESETATTSTSATPAAQKTSAAKAKEKADTTNMENKSVAATPANDESAQAKIEPEKSKSAKKSSAPQPVEPNPDVRFSDDELAMFADVILNSKKEAIDELRMLRERLEDLTSYDMAEESMIYSMHMAEQGSEAMEKEKTFAQIQRINEYIKKLDEALERIKNKTYGICRVCGCLIAKERLLAVPVTTLSASYKIHQKCPEDGIDRIEPVRN